MDIHTLPEDADKFKHLFNALNGNELIRVIANQIFDALRRDRRLAQNLTFPVVAWNWRIDIVAQPSEDPLIHLDGAEGLMTINPEDNSIVKGEEWPRALLISTGGAQSMSSNADSIRRESGQPVPSAQRRGKGQPVSETLGTRPKGPESEFPDIEQQVRERAQRDDPRAAQRLAEAHKGRPHRIVEESPLAVAPEVTFAEKGLALEQAELGQDPRIHRHVEDIEDHPEHSAVQDDVRHGGDTKLEDAKAALEANEAVDQQALADVLSHAKKGASAPARAVSIQTNANVDDPEAIGD